MSDQSRPSRALPEQPSLRYLKVEAKRRLAAGEFTTLHDAQLAIAREHGMSSWATLKAAVEAAEAASSPALAHVRWVTSRFGGADGPAWEVPTEQELREHFDDRYLAAVPPDTMVGTLRSVAASLRDDLLVARATPHSVRARIADLRVEAAAEPDPPHRLTALRVYPAGERVTDSRTDAPPTHASGDVPELAADVIAESFTELGLVGIVLAGTGWAVARGWSDLDRGEELRPDHRFPAYGTTKLITSTAVLRLVADGRVDLDAPADGYLTTLRLEAGDVTVRDLLAHTGGVTSPTTQFADRVPDDVAGLLGSPVPCRERGTFAASNGGYAVLGQLVADVTGLSYPDAVAELVLAPLRMADSWFPDRWPATGAVTGHHLTGDGTFEREPAQVCTMPAAGGLWTTAPDLVRFGTGWSSLLPPELAEEALRPQAAQHVPGASVGLGWLVNPAKDVCGHPGVGPGAGVSLILRRDTGAVTVACANRRIPVEQVNARLIRPIA